MSHLRSEIRRPLAPWVNIGREDAREWWRDHSGASFAEFAQWIAEEYEPHIYRSGFGWRPGRRLTALERDILDDVHVGLVEAWRVEIERRRARHAA